MEPKVWGTLQPQKPGVAPTVEETLIRRLGKYLTREDILKTQHIFPLSFFQADFSKFQAGVSAQNSRVLPP
jgi:hypothetical protein